MRKLYYILSLFFISTVYLFSQTEENEIIKIDTVIRVDTVTIIKFDTVIVIEIDTIIVEEPINEQEGKKEFIKKDFYNDYLSTITDTLKKDRGIASVRLGIGGLIGFSLTWDSQIYNWLNYSSAAFLVARFSDTVFAYCFGLGIVPVRTKNSTLKFDIRPCLLFVKHFTFGTNLGIDFRYRAISLSLDISLAPDGAKNGGIGLLSLGYNFKY